MSRPVFLAFCGLFLGICACEPADTKPVPAPAVSLAAQASGALPAESAPPTPSASALATPPPAYFGVWNGAYEAKKGTLTLNPGASPKRWAKDGGPGALGAGTVKLTITLDGDVQGSVEGALGPGTLRGRAEGDVIRASLFPDDPGRVDAMTGVLVGLVKGDVVKAEIHASGPGATAREAAFELKRP